MLGTIGHVGIAVSDLKASSELFHRLFGKPPDHQEDLPEQMVTTAFFSVGDSTIELTEATAPESPIARFIGKRGEGVHHISFVVENIEEELARLRREGFQLIDEHPRIGADGFAVAFLHPKSTNGVLIELCQKR